MLLRAPAAYHGRLIRSTDYKHGALSNRTYSPKPLRRCTPTTTTNLLPSQPDPLICWLVFGTDLSPLPCHRLQLRGEQVALLALLDSYPIDQGTPTYRRSARTHQVRPEALGYDPANLGEAPLRLSSVKELLRRKGDILSNLEDRHLSVMLEIYKNNVRLAATFVPERFDGDLLIFVATQDRTEPPTDAWRPYVRGQIRVHQVASRHERMTEPGPLAQIGQVLAAELEKRGQDQANRQITDNCRIRA